MTNYQMPKGVEHGKTAGYIAGHDGMTNYQMPKGVEHYLHWRELAAIEAHDELSDAERR